MCKTSFILKISIAALLLSLLAIRCGYDKNPEPESMPGYISYSLRWDSVIPGHPVPEKIRYCIYPSEGGPMIQTDGDARGIRLALPPDKYNILVFNYEAKDIDFSHMRSFTEAEAYLESDNSYKGNKKGSMPLYRAIVESLVVTAGMDSAQTLTPVLAATD